MRTWFIWLAGLSFGLRGHYRMSHTWRRTTQSGRWQLSHTFATLWTLGASIYNVLKSFLCVTKWFAVSLVCFPMEEKRGSALFPGKHLYLKNIRGIALLAAVLATVPATALHFSDPRRSLSGDFAGLPFYWDKTNISRTLINWYIQLVLLALQHNTWEQRSFGSSLTIDPALVFS